MNDIRNFLIIISLLFQSLEISRREEWYVAGLQKSYRWSITGVNIVELDNQNRIVNGVITDINGHYVFEVKDINHDIQISYIGYNNQTFKVNSRTIIDIVLEEKTETLKKLEL